MSTLLARTAVMLAVLVLSPRGALSSDAPEIELNARPFFFALSVSDVDASVKWYETVFQFETTRSIDLAERGIRIRLLRHDSGFLELAEDGRSRDFRDLGADLVKRQQILGVFKIGFEVPDLDEMSSRLAGLGIELRGKVFTESDGSMRSLQILDPDENIVQIFEVLNDR